MSGGGFYQYNCKYWYTHNCGGWVWKNGSACGKCLAEGRDDEAPASDSMSWLLPRDVLVPGLHGGVLGYTLMELVPSRRGSGPWTLRSKPAGSGGSLAGGDDEDGKLLPPTGDVSVSDLASATSTRF